MCYAVDIFKVGQLDHVEVPGPPKHPYTDMYLQFPRRAGYRLWYATLPRPFVDLDANLEIAYPPQETTTPY